MHKLRPYIKPFRKLLLLTLFLASVNQIFALLDPQLFRRIVDIYVSHMDQYTQNQFVRGVGLHLLGMIAVAMISRIAKNFQDYYVNVMTEKIGIRLYQHSIRHAFSLPYSAFEDQQSGQLLQKMHKVRQDIQDFLESVVNILFLGLVGITFVIIYAFTVHWVMGVLFALLLPIMGITMYLMSKKIKHAQKTIVKETTDLAGSTTESIRNVALVKSLGLEEQEMDRLETVNIKILGLELKKIKILRTLEFLQGTLVNTMRMVIMGTMFWLVFTNAMTLGQFFSLFFYSFFVFNPLRQSATVIKHYQEAKASTEVLDEIMSMDPEPLPAHPQVIDTIERIAFDHVSFGYQSAKEVISDINVSINAGDTVAFVGPSGAGKSTLLKLLVGLYKPTAGSLRINDIDIHYVDWQALKQHIGIVAQDTQLFAGTIRENLHFVKPDATDAECMIVLQQAQISDLVTDNLDGLDTKIGEGGIKISGGQRQRLAIARALLRHPDILIFDEATSSLDSLVEQEITNTITDITANNPALMTILVAHRLSTVIHADRIYVLEKGKIVEQGDHQSLLKKHGLYAALRRQQSGENI